MNETFGQKATIATIGGAKERLVFGTRYSVRYGSDDRVIRGVVLAERFANGDLSFVEEVSDQYPDGRTFRVRPSTIDSIFASPDDGGTTHVAQRKPGESAGAMLERLERALGPGQYGRWIATGYGQEVLEEAAREDAKARNGAKVADEAIAPRRRRADPEKVASTIETLFPGVRASVSKIELPEDRVDWPELTSPGERKKARKKLELPPALTGAPVVLDGRKSRVVEWSGPTSGDSRVFAKLRDGRTAIVLGYDSIAGLFRGIEGTADAALARGVELADSLASELGHDPDRVAAAVVEAIPELASTSHSESAAAIRANRAERKSLDQAKPKSSGRPYAERNQVWRCGTCKRRTRAAECANGHPPVAAPAGKRREDRDGGAK